MHPTHNTAGMKEIPRVMTYIHLMINELLRMTLVSTGSRMVEGSMSMPIDFFGIAYATGVGNV